jgi:hypothetical protein
MTERAQKPEWSLWTGGKRTWKGDVGVEIYLRANAPRDARGEIVVPPNGHRRGEGHIYKSEQLEWKWDKYPSGGDIVLVRRA